MAWGKRIPGAEGGFRASVDMRSLQYHPVMISADQQVAIVRSLTQPVLGILQNNPNTGENADVQVLGFSKMVADAAVTRGSQLAVSASGYVVTETNVGSWVFAIAVEAAGAVGDIFTGLIIGPHGL
mgnify:CR=1 FL=1